MTKQVRNWEAQREELSKQLLKYHQEYSGMMNYYSYHTLSETTLKRMREIDNDCYGLICKKKELEKKIFSFYVNYNKTINDINQLIEKCAPPYNIRSVCRTFGIIEKKALGWINNGFLLELLEPHPRKEGFFIIPKKKILVE